jgi:hypothetical protein
MRPPLLLRFYTVRSIIWEKPKVQKVHTRHISSSNFLANHFHSHKNLNVSTLLSILLRSGLLVACTIHLAFLDVSNEFNASIFKGEGV